MGKNFGSSKLTQNIKALFFILNFVSFLFLGIWWFQLIFKAFSIKFEVWDFSDLQIIVFGFITLICYLRFYYNYLKNKNYK